jgi:hypothetical protein
VAGTSEKVFLLPEFGRRAPGAEALHRQWVNLRLSRKGKQVAGYYQNRLALQFEDPSPLTSGRIAVWSVNNGILVGRARVFRDQVSGYHVPLRAYPRFDDVRLSNWVDEQISASVQQTEPGTYRVTNLLSGGPFAVQLKPDFFPPGQAPVLRLKCRFEPGAFVDLYFNVDLGRREGRREHAPPILETWKYILTGPPDLQAVVQAGDSPRPVRLAGKAPENLVDAQWHTVEIDLGTATRGKYALSDLTLGNYSNSGYLLAGLAANQPGAVYELKDIELTRTGGNEPVGEAEDGKPEEEHETQP